MKEKLLRGELPGGAPVGYDQITVDYTFKQKLQGVIYPDGMRYSKHEGKYLTTRINSVFSEMKRLSASLNKKESGQLVESTNISALVGPVGLEPTANGL